MPTDVVCMTTSSSAADKQGRLKADLQLLRRRGAQKVSDDNSNQGRVCARCRAPLGRICNTGAPCPRCRHTVCQQCREYRGNNGQGAGITDWLCSVCQKAVDIDTISGEWMNETSTAKRPGRRTHFSSPAEILKHSIRRSWTITGPPNRSSWCAARGSPELRAYQSLPTRHQDYYHKVVESWSPSESTVESCARKSEKEDLNESVESPTSEQSGINERKDSPSCDPEIDDKRIELTESNEKLDTIEIEVDPEQNEEVDSRSIRKDSKPESSEPQPSSDFGLSKRNHVDVPEEHLKSPNTSSQSLDFFSPLEQSTPRVSLIKPPKIHSKFSTPEAKQAVKNAERKSSIPIFRRSSKEFEDIRSPQESAKRSLIPQRYRGSTDDLRRSREDIHVPSLIPKLFSPRNKEERLKRQDSKDEIRQPLKLTRKDSKELREEQQKPSCLVKDDQKPTGIKVFRRDSKEDLNKVNEIKAKNFPREDINKDNALKIKTFSKEEKLDLNKDSFIKIKTFREEKQDKGEAEVRTKLNETFLKSSTKGLKRDSKEEVEGKVNESKGRREKSRETGRAEVEGEEMVEKNEEMVEKNELMKVERKFEGFKWDKFRRCATEGKKEKRVEKEELEELDQGGFEEEEKDKEIDTSGTGSLVDREKDDNGEVSATDEKKHLQSPEASPLSTRSSRYSPRESESEPTPALPRKTTGGDFCSASQRVRDAITRTRRESNSSARYESSGSESIRLSEPGLQGYFDTRRVRFGGGAGATGFVIGGEEAVQRDSATSAGEDEPHSSLHSSPGRDPRNASGPHGRTFVRRRRQFDTQGTRRRGRSHARGCADDLPTLQTLQLIGRGGERRLSPPGLQGQGQGLAPGQDPQNIDYRRLVFISSDSSSGREEDDADSSSGSSSLNGLPRSGLARGLDDCDWDYFESGTIPLPSIPIGPLGTPTEAALTRDWSCCPGRGSSACQACGGSRGANVLPVPVPIPVPVPYPVPVPASLWTADFTSPSMINCTSAAEGVLRLRGDSAAAPWFAWPPRFTTQTVHHGLRTDRLNLNFKPGADDLDQTSFAFSSGTTFHLSSVLDSGHPVPEPSTVHENGDQVANATPERGAKVEQGGGAPAALLTSGTSSGADVVEENAEKSPSVIDDAGSPTRKHSETETSTADESETEVLPCSRSQSKKMYRLPQGDSGSSSGRSSADSSDLEDSASHRFSRVFVVNDDSLTSDDDDVEDNEDSDSAKEGGITLRRVSALAEPDEPVILRHVRLLDEDGDVAKGQDYEAAREVAQTTKNRRTSSQDSTMVVHSPRSDLMPKAAKKDGNKFERLKHLDPRISEIYLADSKDTPDNQIELMSVKILDPDTIESPRTEDLDLISESQNTKDSDSNSSSSDESKQSEKSNDKSESSDELSGDVSSAEMQDSELDSLMPLTTDSSIIVPDSLEISASSVELGICTDTIHEVSDRTLNDICSGENKYDQPATNTDKPPAVIDKPRALSAVHDETYSVIECSKSSETTSNSSSTIYSIMNATSESDTSTGTTGSSEGTTGSEVSSDELHEYEVGPSTWASKHEEDEAEFSATNKELILSRRFKFAEKILEDHEDSKNKDKTLISEFGESHEVLSDGDGGLTLDSGVVVGVDDTNGATIVIKRDAGVALPSEQLAEESIVVHPFASSHDAARQEHHITPERSDNHHVEIVESVVEKQCKKDDVTTGDIGVQDPSFVPKSEINEKIEARSGDEKIVGKCETVESPVRRKEEVPVEGPNGHSVDDIISSKIHEIFKSVESGRIGNKRSAKNPWNADKTQPDTETAASALSGHDESSVVRGERPELKQVEGIGSGGGGATRFRSVERRPPTRKDGLTPVPAKDSIKNSQNFPSNKYKSLVMITQGTYHPVSVVTSDTTTLLQPAEGPAPQGLAGYFHLALESSAEPHRNGLGPRRPLMVKRPNQVQATVEPEVDSGLSVGSASESDDVQSVKSASRISQSSSSLDQSATRNEQGFSRFEQSSLNDNPQGVSFSNDPTSRGRANGQQGGSTNNAGVVVILEEGLADDDSWVEEVSHDEDEQGTTTATEESSEDEANNLGDREEELRGYHRQAIDFTLHTIVEESCEESEAEPSLASGSPRKQRPPSASELEKYFFFGLGDGNINVGSREIDSLSETSSIYSEGLDSLGQEESAPGGEKNSGEFLNSSRLEKYFLSEFLGFNQDRRDSDGSVGSDSEGRPSPEQRRKRLVRARGTGRSHSSSLDNLLALAQSSQNLSSQNSLQDLSLNPDLLETQSEGSSTETDGVDDQTPVFGTDGQFDTVKRKKKKPRNLGTQSPRIPEDRSKTPELVPEADGDLETFNSEDERAKTPQPESTSFASSGSDQNRAKQLLGEAHSGRSKQQIDSNRSNLINEMNFDRNKQQSRDSGFIGSCDDLLQHQRIPNDSQIPNVNQDSVKDSPRDRDIGDRNGEISMRMEVPTSQSSLPPPNASLSRKDSFNNWSSDEETNLMMSKMRQFFKTMVASSNSNQNSTNNSNGPSPAPSPRLSGTSPKSRIGNMNRTKPPQLVYFENELTRLMKTVPGIRDDQVREIVEYLSSEDTWSDSYDSSDYTSSDLEGAGGRRSALQEQISQSCQQIINKFDANSSDVLSEKENTTQPPQPLNRDTALVYQKLVQSFTKMAGDGVSSDASSTPHSSPPLIAKVMHHIGSRLVALMHEVSEGGPAVQLPSWRRYPHHRTPSSASTTEDDDSTSDSTNTPVQLQLPRSKSHDPLLLLNSHPAAAGQEGEEREASDYERFSWRGSFESALMAADSRTKLSLLACSGDVSGSASALAMAAKRRSAGDLLFNPRSFSREQLDRVRSCGSIGGGSGSIEDKIWSNRRRSSVPDANTRGESGASAGDEDTEDELEYGGDPRATTLPRGLQAAATATATNSLPRLPGAVSGAPGGSTMMHKAHSVHHFLQQHNNVKSARYRPPGFARNSLNCSGGSAGPKRAVSAPGLQIPASQSSSKRDSSCRTRRQQAISLTPDDGSSLSEACSTPIIGTGTRGGSGSHSADDDMDRGLHSGNPGTRASLSSLGARSDSMASVYSGAGEGRWCGSVAVRGEVEFALQYDYKQLTFEVHVTQCRDLAPVDVKRNRSDPYVKVYLLPDKSKSGKRKTKVKKHTLNPVFDETLKFHMNLNGLETRTLWLTVWHSDMFGRNDFLGEVRMSLENKIFDDPTPRWYPLQERTEPFDDPIAYKGEVIVGLKFVPPDPAQQQELAGDQRAAMKARKNWSRGALHVLVKEARNLQMRAKHSGTCDPFCKSYLLPDKGRSGKQKTRVVRRCSGGSPVWGHTFIYKDVSLQELAERGLELTVWDHDRIASNEFLGGVRFNLGTGKHYGKPVDWMDATGREMSLWQSMLERPNFWVEGAVTLRPNLHNYNRSNAT